jgi:signal transduction histidine kinase
MLPTEPNSSRTALVSAEELGVVLQDYMAVTNRLQQTHETLQREIVRLREELASKDRELEVRRRLAALGELAAGLAHEVRNPLGAIQLYSNLLRQHCGRLEPAVELIEKIEAGVQAIDGVVQDTLALAPRDGRGAPRPLRDIVEAAVDNCRPALAERGIELVVRLKRPDVPVCAESRGVQRVLINLLVNAAEASRSGCTVYVQADAPRQGRVAIRVLDEGSGLADEALDRLFDPFFTTKERGTGLGLTIAHRLMEAYGGGLSGRNRPEGGAEFTVVLPVADDARPKQQRAPRRARSSSAA